MADNSRQPDLSHYKDLAPWPEDPTAEEYQLFVEAVHTALFECGIPSEFYPYGKLATCYIVYNCFEFNLTVLMDSGVVLIKVHNFAKYDKEFPLADPYVFDYIVNYIKTCGTTA